MEATGSPRISVLHVDDEPGLAETAAGFLRHENDGFSVETVTSASEGRERLAESTFDCVVSQEISDLYSGEGVE